MAEKIKQIEMKMPREPRKITVKKPNEKMSEKIIKKTKSLADIITAVSVIGAALLGVGSWIVTTINKDVNDKLDTIITKVDTAEQNATRSQLLTLMSDYPDNESEILKVAQYLLISYYVLARQSVQIRTKQNMHKVVLIS